MALTKLLYDKFIDVEFFAEDSLLMSIKTPLYGLKPTISLDIGLLPGNNCYQCVVRIVNLILDTINLQEITHLRITAGYRSANLNQEESSNTSATFRCPVFSAWRETPNPDGVTVFNCLVVGQIEGSFESRLIPVHIYQPTITWRQLIPAILNKVNADGWTDIQYSLSKEILDATVTSSQLNNCYAESGYALIMWLGRELRRWGQAQGKDIVTVVYDNRVIMYDRNGAPDVLGEGEYIVNLDAVESATYTGAVLDVTAPWTPALLPGNLFRMRASVYSAEKTYREIDSSVYIGTNDLYRVITLNVSFNTTEDTNQMTIRAIPIQYAKSPWEATNDNSQLSTVEEAMEKLAAQQAPREVDPLIIGEAPADAVPAFWTIPVSSGVQSQQFKKYTYTPNIQTWTKVAQEAYESHTVTSEESIEMVEAMKNAGYSSVNNVTGVVLDSAYYWPVIVHATYNNWNNGTPAKEVFNFSRPGALYSYDPSYPVSIPTKPNPDVLIEYYKMVARGEVSETSAPWLYLYIAYYLKEIKK